MVRRVHIVTANGESKCRIGYISEMPQILKKVVITVATIAYTLFDVFGKPYL